MTYFKDPGYDSTPPDLRLASPECAEPEPDPADSFRLASLAVGLLFVGLGLLALALQLAIRLGWV